MKLRNKRSGEIGYFCFANWNDPVLIIMDNNGVQLAKYSSLARLNREWEDAPEEPKEYWYIDINGEIMSDNVEDDTVKVMREIGNYFSSREQAEKAVEKLKAFKRVKDEGLTFCGWKITDDGCSVDVETTLDAEIIRAQQKYITDDLNLLFGGKE